MAKELVLVGMYSAKHDNISGAAGWLTPDDTVVDCTAVIERSQFLLYKKEYPDAVEVGEVLRVVRLVDERHRVVH